MQQLLRIRELADPHHQREELLRASGPARRIGRHDDRERLHPLLRIVRLGKLMQARAVREHQQLRRLQQLVTTAGMLDKRPAELRGRAIESDRR